MALDRELADEFGLIATDGFTFPGDIVINRLYAHEEQDESVYRRYRWVHGLGSGAVSYREGSYGRRDR